MVSLMKTSAPHFVLAEPQGGEMGSPPPPIPLSLSLCLSLSVSLTHTLFPFAWMRNSISLSSTGSHLELMRQTSLRTLQLTEREGTLGK